MWRAPIGVICDTIARHIALTVMGLDLEVTGQGWLTTAMPDSDRTEWQDLCTTADSASGLAPSMCSERGRLRGGLLLAKPSAWSQIPLFPTPTPRSQTAAPDPPRPPRSDFPADT